MGERPAGIMPAGLKVLRPANPRFVWANPQLSKYAMEGFTHAPEAIPYVEEPLERNARFLVASSASMKKEVDATVSACYDLSKYFPIYRFFGNAARFDRPRARAADSDLDTEGVRPVSSLRNCCLSFYLIQNDLRQSLRYICGGRK